METQLPETCTQLPRLSVIVANYNHGRELPACLDALLDQSAPAWEILVIDDGSTDDSWQVIQRYAQMHSQIRPHRSDKNRGTAMAINQGIELASGDYLFLPAADDTVIPGLFEKSLRLLARYPSAALSCSISQWRDVHNGLTWLMAAGMANTPCYLSPDDLVRLGRRGRLSIVSHSAILNASIVREVGGYRADLKWHCDWFLTYIGALRYGLCFVPEVLSVVNLHDNSYYQCGHRSREHAHVMNRLLDLLLSEEFQDVGDRMRESAALALHSTAMLRAIWRHPRYRDYLTPLFLWRCLVRRSQVVARRWFPNWLARICLRLFNTSS